DSNSTLGTIAGILNWHEWSWPNNEAEIEYIYAMSLPGIGSWKKFTPANIQKNCEKVIKSKIQGHKNLLFGYHGVYCFAKLILSEEMVLGLSIIWLRLIDIGLHKADVEVKELEV
ncbi:12015_t:CDS:2, partial [Dentiscutata erythropus]